MEADLEADAEVDITRVTVKLPRTVVRTLSRVAKRHHRSLQGEVADVLERHADEYGSQAGRPVGVA